MANHFSYRLRIYVPDTDYGGIVYHANYLKFMDQARTEWLSSVGLPLQYFASHQIHFIICGAEIEYLRPVRLDYVIAIDCSISKVGNSVVHFAHVVFDPDNPNTIYCKATVKVVCVNGKFKPIAVPKEILDKLGFKKED